MAVRALRAAPWARALSACVPRPCYVRGLPLAVIQLRARVVSTRATAHEEALGGEALAADAIITVQYTEDFANRLITTGYVAAQPEAATVHVGGEPQQVVRTNLSVKRYQSSATPDLFNVEVMGALGKRVMSDVRKGDLLVVEGPLRQDRYTDPATQAPKLTLTVLANKIMRVQRKGEGGGDGGSGGSSFQGAASAAPQPDPEASVEEKWKHYFAHPDQYWDNRTNKRNPKAPDFKHKTNGSVVLWINSMGIPSWVPGRLAGDAQDAGASPSQPSEGGAEVHAAMAPPAPRAVSEPHADAAASASPGFAAGKPGPAVPAANASLDTKWNHYLSYPEQYWDNRTSKRVPNGPDFVHKTQKGLTLWLTSRETPSWVLDRLSPGGAAAGAAGAAEQRQQAQGGGGGGGASTAAAAGGPTIDERWKHYFDNPHEYWDNRNKKLGPRSPDFTHKEKKREALWIDSRNTPDWVKEELGV